MQIEAGSLDEIHLRSAATYIADHAQDVAHQLQVEGGKWPTPLQPHYPLPLRDLPPSVFEDNK
jgi:hypothetical protein